MVAKLIRRWSMSRKTSSRNRVFVLDKRNQEGVLAVAAAHFRAGVTDKTASRGQAGSLNEE